MGYPLLLVFTIAACQPVVVHKLDARSSDRLVVYDDGAVATDGLSGDISLRVEAFILCLRTKDIAHITIEDGVGALHHIPLVDGDGAWHNLE